MTLDRLATEILTGCSADNQWYGRYMRRTAWRVGADVKMLAPYFREAGSLLDIGGTPPILSAAAKEAGVEKVVVLDPSVKKFENFFRCKDIRAVEGDLLTAEDDVFQGSKFDVVCLCEVMEHITGNLLDVIGKIDRWVKPGGYLFLTTPNLRSISGALALFWHGGGLASKPKSLARAQYERASGTAGYFGHVREYTPREVIDLVVPAGFELAELKFQPTPFRDSVPKRIVSVLETAMPRLRLMAKYLFRKKGIANVVPPMHAGRHQYKNEAKTHE